jgi:cytidylate kinase
MSAGIHINQLDAITHSECCRPGEQAHGRKPNIAIDGPAGAGKTTIARLAARRLGFTYISTGSLYRAITLGLLRRGVDILAFEQSDSKDALLQEIQVSVGYDSDEPRIYLDGADVTDQLSSPVVTQWVSEVARVPAVRAYLLELQRSCARPGGVIMDGRDIGSVVLKDAEFKFFLTASVEERARRRTLEMQSRGEGASFDEVRAVIEKRDRIDSTRSTAPLCKAEDAIEIDTTGKSIEEVLEELLSHVRSCGES